jgi:hypothetical protein
MAAKQIAVGYHVFLADGGEEIGAVRDVVPDRSEIVIWVENAGDFSVPLDAIESVHAQKVILDGDKLSPALQDAIGHAHDAEEPGV